MAGTQLYKSTDLNAPPLSGQAGSILRVLDVLVNGYGWSGVSITALTRSGSTCTATVSAADGLRLKTGMLLTVSGANESGYNGTWSITVTSTTQFTFTIPGTPTTPATGTIVLSSLLPITSISRTSTTATVTLANADTSLVTGQWVTIDGANESDYNGTFQITVTGSTTFTYQVANSPSTPATGTITYKRAGQGWATPFTGTNKAVFRSADTNSNRFYLRVLDDASTTGGAKECTLRGYETMSDVDTGTGAFPTVAQYASGFFMRKSTTADTTLRAWTLVADTRTFYLFDNTGDAGNTYTHSMGFGYFLSYKSGDAYNTFLAGGTVTNSAATKHGLTHGTPIGVNASVGGVGLAIPRAYTQIGTAVLTTLSAGVAASAGNYQGFGGSTTYPMAGCVMAYPHAVDNGLYVVPVLMLESTTAIRGRMPGLFAPIQPMPLNHYDLATNVIGLSGITLTAIETSCYDGSNNNYKGMVFYDTFGSW